MTNINILISKIPNIISAREYNIDYKSIKKMLLEKFDINTNETELRRLMYSYHKDTLKLKFKNLKLAIMSPSDILLNNDIMRYLIRFNDYSELVFIINRDISINEKYQITLDKIKRMENPSDRIYAKWFTRMFNVVDHELINTSECTQEQMNEINRIPLVIDDLYKDVNNKILDRIMGN